jgi:hypothetical protein
MIHFISVKSTYKVYDVAQVFLKQVVKLHSLSMVIVPNHNSIFNALLYLKIYV